MENSNCHVSVQLASPGPSQPESGLSAPSTGHGDEGKSTELSPFPVGRDQNVSGWKSPKSSSLLGFELLPVLGGRKYQANSSVHDFKTSTSSTAAR